MNKSYTSRKKTNTGFTLAETLLTVAILTILMGIAFVNVVSMQKSMNQLQADKQARILFQEAEQRMNEISAYDEVSREKLSNNSESVKYPTAITELNEKRGSKRQPKLLYLQSSKGTNTLDLSEEYDSYQYIIEYQPETLDVIGVFVTKSEKTFYEGQTSVDTLRESSEKRMEYVKDKGYESPIGYYGLKSSEKINPVPVIADSPILCDAVLEDGDELKAVFYATIPDNKDISEVSSNGYYVHATIKSVDGSKVAAFRASIPASAFKTGEGDEAIFTKTREAEFSITIDGAGDAAFKNTFGQAATASIDTLNTSAGKINMGGTGGSELSVSAYNQLQIKIEYDSANSAGINFIPGENIVITAYAEPIPNEGEGIQSSDTERTTGNSLFASATLDASVYKATISNARHLQNLDTETSGFVLSSLDEGVNTASSMTAVMADDIIAAEVQTDETDEAEDTGDTQTATINELTSITNEKLTSFNGGKYAIEGFTITPRAGEAAGLFSVFSGNSISNVTMKSCVIDGSVNNGKSGGIYRSGGLIGTWNIKSGENTLNGCSMQGVRVFGGANVGGLVGGIPTNEGTVKVESCNLYMRPGVDFDDDLTADKITKENNNLWLSGSQFAGGLVGATAAQLTINNSYAATVVNGGTQAGGLIGMSSDNVTLNVTNSYADCYISAPTIGGLAGSCADTSTFTSCYSAGFVLNPTANTKAAKFVPNKNIKIGKVGEKETSYSYFSFYDITKAKASDDSDVPSYEGVSGTYCITPDGDHRIDNGFGMGETDLSKMKVTPSGEQGECYNLAEYFHKKKLSSFTGAQAGLPHYGDYYDEPDEYMVNIKSNYGGVEETQSLIYRSKEDFILGKFRSNWNIKGYSYRDFTKTAIGEDIDEFIAGSTNESKVRGYLDRKEFERYGEGVWKLTRYVKWEPCYGISLLDPLRQEQTDNENWSRYYRNELDKMKLSDFVFSYIIDWHFMGDDDGDTEEITYSNLIDGNNTKGLKLLSIINSSNAEQYYSANDATSIFMSELVDKGWFDGNNDVVIELVWETSEEKSGDGE